MTQRPRSEFDYLEPPQPHMGAAEAVYEEAAPHTTHAFLYVPDLSSQTGWAGHAVPMERQERVERRPVGFRR